MKNAVVNTITKENILTLLEEWINQRPGLDPRDYGWGRDGWLNYRQESARITRQKQDALILLRAVEYSQITAEDLIKAFRAYSGRLQLAHNEKGHYLEYCTGQYWPTEYRAAACAVLASALWDYHRPDYADDDHAGDKLRAMFKRRFGRGIASRWLD
jgi:hypothetical protein